MDNIPPILRAVGGMTPEQMVFVIALVALGVVGVIASLALTGGRRDDKA
jgi:hypothetical protein